MRRTFGGSGMETAMAVDGKGREPDSEGALTVRLRQAERLLACHAWDRADRLAQSVFVARPDDPAALRLKRRLLAMRERAADAAADATVLTAGPDAAADDWFRRAQIEMRLGDPVAAFDSAMEALDRGCRDPRLIEPLVAGALVDPDRERQLLACCRGAEPGLVAVDDSGDRRPVVGVPWCQTWYEPHNGRHPLMTATLAAPGDLRLLLYLPDPPAAPPMVSIAAAWPGVRARFAALGNAADRPMAAERAVFFAFRSLRFGARPPQADVEFLHTFPYTVGATPFVFHLEQPENLFGPLHPWPCFELTRDTPSVRLTRALFADPRCIGILTHIKETRRGLAAFFDDPRITAKLTYVRYGAAPPPRPPRPSGPRWRGDVCTFLFTNGFTPRPVNFFLRGGVDVLAAFLRLNRVQPKTRLVIAAPLPAHADPRLIERVLRHPHIRWIQERLDDGAFAALFQEADAYLLPSVMVHAVSVIQAMHAGLPPIVTDSIGFSEFVRPRRNGLVVPGRRLAVWRPEAGEYRIDYLPVLNALGNPADPLFTGRLVSAMGELAGDPALRHRLGAQAHRDARRLHTGEAWCRGVRDWLADGLASRER